MDVLDEHVAGGQQIALSPNFINRAIVADADYCLRVGNKVLGQELDKLELAYVADLRQRYLLFHPPSGVSSGVPAQALLWICSAKISRTRPMEELPRPFASMICS